MAIDTAAKRMSIPGVGRPWMRGQRFDAALGVGWRQSAGNGYAGFTPASPAVITQAALQWAADLRKLDWGALGVKLDWTAPKIWRRNAKR